MPFHYLDKGALPDETDLKNDELTVKLHKPDVAILEKARNIGNALVAMNQGPGQALVDAVDGVLDLKEPGPPARATRPLAD